MLTIANVTFDCANALELARFWSAVMQKPIDDGANQYFATIASSPTMMFLMVPEGNEVKNRCHVDLSSDDRETEVKRLLDLGATHVAEHDEYDHRWTVLRDPSGNEFCVA